MSLSFTDKVVLVTGSGGGLGKEIASRYLESGAKVVLCDINEERLKETEGELSPKGIVLAHKVDITDEDSVKELTEAAVAKFGRLDIVVNNAGVTDKFDPVGSVDKKLWDNVMAVNVTGTFLISKYAVNQMLAQKPVGGAIVNIISVAGFRGFVAGAAYTASKHAAIGVTKNTASYYGRKGIRCNAVLPGAMQTNMADERTQGEYNHDGVAHITKYSPGLGTEWVEVGEVADLCLFLSHESANGLNGQLVSADRGFLSTA